MNTKDRIINRTLYLFSRYGSEGVSIRELAKDLQIAPSVIYHHYDDKKHLLSSMYLHTVNQLKEFRSLLPSQPSFEKKIRQIITFQILHAEKIVGILKYYLTYRKSFMMNTRGYLPEKSYLHFDEILNELSNEYKIPDPAVISKIMTHTVNGYLLEYFPNKFSKSDQQKLIRNLTEFFQQSLDKYKLS